MVQAQVVVIRTAWAIIEVAIVVEAIVVEAVVAVKASAVTEPATAVMACHVMSRAKAVGGKPGAGKTADNRCT